MGIIIRCEPVTAPFVHVLAHVVESETVAAETGNNFGAMHPTVVIVGQRVWRFVSPGEQVLFRAAASSIFPLRLGGQPKALTASAGKPGAVLLCLEPGNCRHRLERKIEVLVI